MSRDTEAEAQHVVTRVKRMDPTELPIPIRRVYTRVNKKPGRCGNHLRVVNGGEKREWTGVWGKNDGDDADEEWRQEREQEK